MFSFMCLRRNHYFKTIDTVFSVPSRTILNRNLPEMKSKCLAFVRRLKETNLWNLIFSPRTAQVPRENEVASNGPASGKKPRGRGLLRSLLCCLGRGRGGSSKSSKASPLQFYNGDSPIPRVRSPRFLLPPVKHQDMHKKCMVIDLDETLVHSSFKPINNADFVVPVEIDGTVHQVYVLKRPYVDEFLERMGELYECVLFTASLAKVCGLCILRRR